MNCNCVRLLECEDYHRGFLEILGQLTPTHKPTYPEFCKRLTEMQQLNPTSYTFVMENNGVVIATAKIFIELKMHNQFTKMGHIEDVVVSGSLRGQGLGKLLTEYLCEFGKKSGCYKIVLDCSLQNVPFYEKCGFKHKGSEMAIYYNHG